MPRAKSELERYRDKRDPARTNEPFAEPRAVGGATRMGRFVVHLHDATREHYDVRLEVGGTLKSFAVPRGPSLNPEDKRLAVNTEDHPIEYLEFEDVIPDGNYGAGPMIVWDQGRVRYLEGTAEEGIERGKIDFELSGFKLRGRYGLIHTGARARNPADKNQWLLVKKTDAHSSSDRDILSEDPRSVLSGLLVDELVGRNKIANDLEAEAARLGAVEDEVELKGFVPMMCAVDGATLDDPDRWYELKLDGVRILASRQDESVVLRYRGGRLATATYPDVARALRALPSERFVLDGEIVTFDEVGRPRFQRLAPRLSARRPQDILRATSDVPVVYVVFDILQIGSRSLVKLPLSARKDLLARFVRGRGQVRVLDHLQGHGRELFEFCRRERLEGVVAKRAESPYRPGPMRTSDWVKIKCERDEEFVIVGWEEGRGSRKLGALRLATYDESRLILRGKVGTGFDDAMLRELERRLAELATTETTAEGVIENTKGPLHHVEPTIVARVRFSGWTDDGYLREPIFQGLRDDVDPKSCTAAAPGGEMLDPEQLPEPETLGTGQVLLKNRDKVFWPEQGYTKGDLLDYYAKIAPYLLPFLRDRPVILVRYPDGIHGKSFYQWRPPEGTPTWLKTLELRDDDDREDRGSKSVFLIDSADALLYIANLGCIPIHVLASRAADLECGDFFTIDFDLGEGTFRDAITLMMSLKALLTECGLSGYPKTSGQTGLHVLVPVGPNVSFTITKALAELFGRVLEAEHPKIATAERRVEKRGPRVFIDTGQTGRSRAIVAPYSVRAVPGATVSTPLSWEEVHVALDPRRFDIVSVPVRAAERGDLLKGMLDARPDVGAVVAKLQTRFQR